MPGFRGARAGRRRRPAAISPCRLPCGPLSRGTRGTGTAQQPINGNKESCGPTAAAGRERSSTVVYVPRHAPACMYFCTPSLASSGSLEAPQSQHHSSRLALTLHYILMFLFSQVRPAGAGAAAEM